MDPQGAYYRLVNLLNGRGDFAWHNCSVPAHDPLLGGSQRHLYEQLAGQVGSADVVLVIGGMYVNFREWIQAEIELAQEYGIPIIGVRPYAARKFPREVHKRASDIVGWRAESIIRAVYRHG